MSEYVITTDNNSDLPEEYLKDHGVGCMYLSYSMDGKNYTHGNFLPEHEFYEAMRNGSMPTTAQVNPENAKALLEPYLKEGKDILHIAFSSALSGTYNSSRIAAEELMEDYPDRKIIVVDSLGASLGQGFWFTLHRRRKSREKIWRQLRNGQKRTGFIWYTFYSQRFKPPIPRRPHFQNYCSSRKYAEY